jgi:tetratricopeptide (TPR) repeat protein
VLESFEILSGPLLISHYSSNSPKPYERFFEEKFYHLALVSLPQPTRWGGMARFCSACGNRIDTEDAKFCSKCGAKIVSALTTEQKPVTQPAESPKTGIASDKLKTAGKWIAICCAGVILAFIIAVFIYGMAGSTPTPPTPPGTSSVTRPVTSTPTQEQGKVTTQGDAMGHITAGESLIHSQEYALAISEFDKAIELDPQSEVAYSDRGFANAALNKYSTAILDYNKAIELNPQFATAYNNRGLVYYALEQYSNAIRDYTKAIEINPRALYHTNRGTANYKLEKYSDAILDYTKAIEIDPQFGAAYLLRGQVNNDLKKYSDALSDYSKAIDFYPQSASAYIGRGYANLGLENPSNALLDCTKGIELSPQSLTAYICRGIAYYQLDKYSNAISDCSKAIELNPTLPWVYAIRGDSYLYLERSSDAIFDFTSAIELWPNDALLYLKRGIANYNLHKLSETIRDCTEGITIESSSSEPDVQFLYFLYALRSKSYTELGEDDKAMSDGEMMLYYQNHLPPGTSTITGAGSPSQGGGGCGEGCDVNSYYSHEIASSGGYYYAPVSW